MAPLVNPFHELYVTETARPEEFVELFSPVLVPHALLLFQNGNVVLRGTQGSGKSMLLNLLRPEIKLAYQEAGQDFPVPKKFAEFISAGINLTKSGILDIGQRPITKNGKDDERLFPLFFGDFLNYWIVRDILRTLQTVESAPHVFSYVAFKNKENFAELLSSAECWFGYLAKAKGFDALLNAIEQRIQLYRAFHIDNIPALPDSLMETKTNIGEPISQAVQCLWESETLSERIPVFVRIDQHEVLSRSDDLRPTIGIEYRRIINKALSRRDPRVSYRLGTRRYAWGDDLSVFGTSTPLEILRDYRVVDIDQLLTRKEDRSTWMFPRFAEDIFGRRLRHAKLNTNEKRPLQQIFGSSPRPSKAAKDYVGTNTAERALKIEDIWTDEWKNFIADLFVNDPLAAKLVEAWLRQKGPGGRLNAQIGHVPRRRPCPWERAYWKKERLRQALFQLAARCAQKPMWYGRENFLSLCSGGSLIFVSVCQHVWDAFLRSQVGVPESEQIDPTVEGIPIGIQALGIASASSYWYDKITEQSGGGERRRFISFLGRHFYSILMDDRAMSYPGHNGFSLPNIEFDSDPEVRRFLNDAADYGDLQNAPHTTKSKAGEQRTKWYLNPILSPHFKLPESHVKEPEYIDIRQIRKWLSDLGIIQEEPTKGSKAPANKTDSRQLSFLRTL
jgi:hypothetical protein